MGKKKKGNKASSGTTTTTTATTATGRNSSAAAAAGAATTSSMSLASSPPVGPNDALIAVVEFHHMLIGPTHKKEAAALGAAACYGICGFVFMGGPSAAIVYASALHDLTAWLADCKKAGKQGQVKFWKVVATNAPPPMNHNNKLKVVPYATGKDTKMDTVAYQKALATMQIPCPLPPCASLFLY